MIGKNRIDDLFHRKNEEILNIYFTAGHPGLNDTVPIIKYLDKAGADMIEVGMPYSDPLADGFTIQQSSAKALKNGMTLNLLFRQIASARRETQIPLILMGYLNQVIQFGPKKFLDSCVASGIDGLIIPDLPMNIYEKEYRDEFESRNLKISFLITPQTSDDRILQADRLSSAFLYMVSQSSITGRSESISEFQLNYFQRVKNMRLKQTRLIGFGIHNHASYEFACDHANGAIIGSAFIRALESSQNIESSINNFIQNIR